MTTDLQLSLRDPFNFFPPPISLSHFFLFSNDPNDPVTLLILYLTIMDSTINTKQNSQRIVRHTEYYIHGGDIIFRVRGSHDECFVLPSPNCDASTGGRHLI